MTVYNMLSFIQELTEARLYRGEQTLEGKKADDLANIAYLMIMMLEILRHEDFKYAQDYARSTLSYSSFDHMRSSATDLYNLLSVLNEQTEYEDRITPNPSISVPALQIKRYLRDLENGRKDPGLDRALFLKIESFFSISSTKLKQIRRSVGQWNDNSITEKSTVRKEIKNILQNVSQQNDIFVHFKNHVQKHEI